MQHLLQAHTTGLGTDTTHDLKRFNTAQALAALHGVTLHRLEGDFGRPIYCATRWAMNRQLDDLDQVEAWLQMVTGKKVEA